MEKLIKTASDGKIVYYSDLTDGDTSLVRSLGAILEKITRYDIENKQSILASIIALKEIGLPSGGFFEMCDTLDIDAYLSDLQKESFEYWGTMAK